MLEFGPIIPSPKIGNEPFGFENQVLDVKLLDFWRWGMSNLVSNATRGILAEFIVATALKIDIHSIREEWSPYDLTTAEGIKIEVKSSAYLQTWKQNNFSKIIFSIGPARPWDSATNLNETIARRCSDVYVFCLLRHQLPETLNPLQMEQWEFYVLPTSVLNERLPVQKTISVKSLQKMTEVVGYERLREKVLEYRMHFKLSLLKQTS